MPPQRSRFDLGPNDVSRLGRDQMYTKSLMTYRVNKLNTCQVHVIFSKLIDDVLVMDSFWLDVLMSPQLGTAEDCQKPVSLGLLAIAG